ncbi:MAG TPA: ferric reductase-like transmembrane domain-containing protein [Dictyobacter sp.]|jgi:predicted ferric reductase|nr:ferric reductase-like transmembrane domain-containing protein [Dictyobacter sp.]
MSTLWSNIDWSIARSGGITAYILLTLAMFAGLMLSLRWQSPAKWPRLITNELHNFLSLLSLIFIVIHVLAVWIDPFTHFGLSAVFIPFVSGYRPLWVGMGIVALYLGIAVGISTWMRPKIGYRLWRRLHLLTFLGFIFALIHGIGSGSDSHSTWAIAMYAISMLIVGIPVAVRISGLGKTPQKKQAPLAQPRPAVKK